MLRKVSDTFLLGEKSVGAMSGNLCLLEHSTSEFVWVKNFINCPQVVKYKNLKLPAGLLIFHI